MDFNYTTTSEDPLAEVIYLPGCKHTPSDLTISSEDVDRVFLSEKAIASAHQALQVSLAEDVPGPVAHRLIKTAYATLDQYLKVAT